MAKGPAKLVWGSEHQENIKYHNFEEVVHDDQALYSWIHGNFVATNFSVAKANINHKRVL